MKGMEGERYRQTVQKKERCGEKQGELKEEKAGREKKDSDWKGGESEAETAAADAGGRGGWLSSTSLGFEFNCHVHQQQATMKYQNTTQYIIEKPIVSRMRKRREDKQRSKGKRSRGDKWRWKRYASITVLQQNWNEKLKPLQL